MISQALFVCLREILAEERQQDCGWNIFSPASLNCPGSICCTRVIHLHLPLHPPSPFKACSSRNVLFSVMFSSGKSACTSDVEFEYIWHCNLNDSGLNKIRVCVALRSSVTFNSSSFNTLEKNGISQLIYMTARCWACFSLLCVIAHSHSKYGRVYHGQTPLTLCAFAGFCCVVHVPTQA